jgi:hypothetical protein
MDLVVIISDKFYEHHAKCLIDSIQIRNDIAISWIRLSADESESPDFTVSTHFQTINLKQFGVNDEQRRAYASTCRFRVIKQLFENNSDIETILYLDADSLVRRSLFPIISRFNRANSIIGLRTRDHQLHPYLAGFLLFNRKSIDLLGEIAQEVDRNPYEWGSDQDALKNVLSKNTDSVHKLDPKYVGWDLRFSLIIWSAKGHSRRRSPEFLFESACIQLVHRCPKRMRTAMLPTIFFISQLLSILNVRSLYFSGRQMTSQIVHRVAPFKRQ